MKRDGAEALSGAVHTKQILCNKHWWLAKAQRLKVLSELARISNLQSVIAVYRIGLDP